MRRTWHVLLALGWRVGALSSSSSVLTVPWFTHSAPIFRSSRVVTLLRPFPLWPRSHSRPKSHRSVRTSVHADGLELLTPGIGDGRFTAVGQHDRRAVGRVQSVQQGTGRKLWGLRKLFLHVLGAYHLHIGNLAAAQERKRFGRDHRASGGDVIIGHGTRLLTLSSTRRALL